MQGEIVLDRKYVVQGVILVCVTSESRTRQRWIIKIDANLMIMYLSVAKTQTRE